VLDKHTSSSWRHEIAPMTDIELIELKRLSLKAFNSAVKSFDATAQRIFREAFDQASVELIRMRNSKK
jgi:uncharacterized protein YeaO (DUF488 family)